MTYLPPFPPEVPEPAHDRADHGWIVSHLIGLIGYCEAQGLAEAEQALIEATERLAPILNGHRLAQLRADQARPMPSAITDFPAAILHMPPPAGMETRHVPT